MIKLKDLMKEVSVAASTGTFVGGAGDIIDQKFAGGFHPEFGDLKKLLNQQVDDDIAKRMYTDDTTPPSDKDFEDIEWKYGFDEPYEPYDKSKFINDSTTNMKYVDIDIKYDEPVKYAGQNFINKSRRNWKHIK